MAVITGKASAYQAWSRQRPAQGEAQPPQECVTDLGIHGQTLTDVAEIEQVFGQQLQGGDVSNVCWGCVTV